MKLLPQNHENDYHDDETGKNQSRNIINLSYNPHGSQIINEDLDTKIKRNKLYMKKKTHLLNLLKSSSPSLNSSSSDFSSSLTLKIKIHHLCSSRWYHFRFLVQFNDSYSVLSESICFPTLPSVPSNVPIPQISIHTVDKIDNNFHGQLKSKALPSLPPTSPSRPNTSSNKRGFSNSSSNFSPLSSPSRPSTSSSPTLSINSSKLMSISWSNAQSNGSEIIKYQLYIKRFNKVGQFYYDPTTSPPISFLSYPYYKNITKRKAPNGEIILVEEESSPYFYIENAPSLPYLYEGQDKLKLKKKEKEKLNSSLNYVNNRQELILKHQENEKRRNNMEKLNKERITYNYLRPTTSNNKLNSSNLSQDSLLNRPSTAPENDKLNKKKSKSIINKNNNEINEENDLHTWILAYENINKSFRLNLPDSSIDSEWWIKVRALNSFGWSNFSPILVINSFTHPFLFTSLPPTSSPTRLSTPSPLASLSRDRENERDYVSIETFNNRLNNNEEDEDRIVNQNTKYNGSILTSSSTYSTYLPPI